MEELPSEIMDKVLGYFEHNMPTIKSLRRVSKGFEDLASPVLFSTITVFEHPKSEAKLHAISNQPLLALHVKKIRVPSLIFLEKLDSSGEDDHVQLQFKPRDPGWSSVLYLKAASARSTAAFKYKQTCVWQSSKAEGAGLSASSFDMPPGPVRGLPLDIALFPFLKSIDIADRDWRWKMVEATTYGFSGPWNYHEHSWSCGVYGQDIMCSNWRTQIMSLAIRATKAQDFAIDSFKLVRYWEIVQHQSFPSLDLKGLRKLTLDFSSSKTLDRELLDGSTWKLAPALCNTASLQTLEISQDPEARVFYDVLELVHDVHWPILAQVVFNKICTRAATLEKFLLNHRSSLRSIDIHRPMIQSKMWVPLRYSSLADLPFVDGGERIYRNRGVNETVEEEDLPWYRGEKETSLTLRGRYLPLSKEEIESAGGMLRVMKKKGN